MSDWPPIGVPRLGSVAVNCTTHGLYWSDLSAVCPLCERTES